MFLRDENLLLFFDPKLTKPVCAELVVMED